MAGLTAGIHRVPEAEAGKERDIVKRLKVILAQKDEGAQFVWMAIRDVFSYASFLLEDISGGLVKPVDEALKWGFNWDMGPFELWQALGAAQGNSWEMHRLAAKTNLYILISVLALLVALLIQDKEIQALQRAVKALRVSFSPRRGTLPIVKVPAQEYLRLRGTRRDSASCPGGLGD